MIGRWLTGALALLALAGCDREPAEPEAPPRPAMWEVTDKSGAKGWLFGTVHDLPVKVKWRTKAFDQALAASDQLVLEIANADDPAAISAIFTRLGRSPGHPPLSQRLPEAQRQDLLRWMKVAGLSDPQSHELESWAAALILAQASGGDDDGGGVDAAIQRLAGDKPVIELEGAEAQLAIFDAMPELLQRKLLLAVVEEGDGSEEEAARLAKEWRAGNMDALAAETTDGMLADAQLRETLLLSRNREWVRRITGMLHAGKQPFVAVGAGHMAGPHGLPAGLVEQGFEVKRIQ